METPRNQQLTSLLHIMSEQTIKTYCRDEGYIVLDAHRFIKTLYDFKRVLEQLNNRVLFFDFNQTSEEIKKVLLAATKCADLKDYYLWYGQENYFINVKSVTPTRFSFIRGMSHEGTHSCTICYEDLDDNTPIMNCYQCSYQYCRDCFQGLERKVCPQCRTIVPLVLVR